MNVEEKQYLDLMREVLENGTDMPNRTKENCRVLFGRSMRFDLSKGFPLFTTKKVWFKGIVHELLWFLAGDTNIKYLVDNKVNIWNGDAYRYHKEQNPSYSETTEKFIEEVKLGRAGNLGPVYGAQWRNWNGIDQINDLVNGLKNDPYSRRHILNAWRVDDIEKMALPPCHIMSMFSVVKGKLNCNFIMRSNDLFLGTPYNIASYALLTNMLAKATGLGPGELVYWAWNVHLYKNHFDAVKIQLEREPKDFPKLDLEEKNIDDYTFDDIKLINYNSYSTIKAELVT